MSKFVPPGLAVGGNVKDSGMVASGRIPVGAIAGMPGITGTGPTPAARKLCSRLGLTPVDFGIIELKDAFASQGIAKDAAHVNRKGGAIADGHPLGMGSARITGTAAIELSLSGERRALATNGIGFGEGVAASLERV